VTLVLALAVAAGGSWHAAKTIVVSPPAKAAYARLVIPQAIDGGPDGAYADLRIAGASNREMPYALDADPVQTGGAPVSLSDVGFVPGRYTQAVADLGPAGTLHSNLTIDTPQPTFFERVEVATSDDRRTWAIVASGALVYRVAANADAGRRAIDFPPTRARWIRIRILNGAHAFPIAGASVTPQNVPARLVPLEGTSAARTSDGRTVVTFDFVTPNANVGAVAFESATREFSRRVTFETANAGVTGSDLVWEDAGAATISRFFAGRPELTVDLGNRHARMLRATIQNGNDLPLASLRVTPLGYEHHLIFRADPATAYRLLWDNPAAAAPTYDLADLLAHESWRPGAVATLGAAASTALETLQSPARTTPWLQQAALPIALCIAFFALGAIALLSLRSKPSS
jgi:hypothetical protein